MQRCPGLNSVSELKFNKVYIQQLCEVVAACLNLMLQLST